MQQKQEKKEKKIEETKEEESEAEVDKKSMKRFLKKGKQFQGWSSTAKAVLEEVCSLTCSYLF